MKQTMAIKPFKKTMKPLAANAPANPPAAVNPLAKPAQNSQPTSLSKVVATETSAAKPSGKATPAAEPSKPLTPLAVARPRITAVETPKAPETAAVGEKAPAMTATQKVNVTLALREPAAKQVSLCGEFNGWASDAAPMKQRQGGLWETTVALAPGRYQYKFVVDGNWIPDPQARESVWNPHGTLNSVVEVRA
jgi:hypothetical protein